MFDLTRCVSSVADYPFKGLDRDLQPEFGCYNITDTRDPKYPHVKAIMYNNLVATDSTFLFGEIISNSPNYAHTVTEEGPH